MQTLGNMPFMQIGPHHYIVRLPVPPQPAVQAAVVVGKGTSGSETLRRRASSSSKRRLEKDDRAGS